MGTHEEATRVLGLWLEVDLDSEPITGSIRVADETPRPFVGWLGLTAVLEAVHRRVGITGRVPRAGIDQRLTRAERDIVELVCEGLTNPQIAQRLAVSPRTIQGHLLKVFRKFGVSTRAELVARMLRGLTNEARAITEIDPGLSANENAPSGAQGIGSTNETFSPAGNTSDRDTQRRGRSVR